MIKKKGNNNMGVAKNIGVIKKDKEKCSKKHAKYKMIE
jgi:hypothetical protein